MCNVAERLLEERKRLGFSQQQMAEFGGVAKRTYCNYESGERDAMGGFFAAIAAVGADVQYILTGIHGKQYDVVDRADYRPGMVANNQAEYLTPRQKALLDNVEHCSEEDQRAIERMALLAAKADTDATAETANGQEEAVNPLKKSA